MRTHPAGALSTIQEVRNLIYKAKVEGEDSTLYVIDGTVGFVPSFTKFQLTSTACLTGNTVFLNLSSKKVDAFNFYRNVFLPAYNIGSSGRPRGRYIFSNYFHAWGYYQRLKQGFNDQQKRSQEISKQKAGQFFLDKKGIIERA